MGPILRGLFAIGLGTLFGTTVGVVNLLIGLANNWRTVPAWAFAGALIGAAHPTAELLLHVLLRVGDRIDRWWACRRERREAEQSSELEQ